MTTRHFAITAALWIISIAPLAAAGLSESTYEFEETLGNAREIVYRTGSVDVEFEPTDGEPRVAAALHTNRDISIQTQGGRATVVIEGNIGFVLGRITKFVTIYVNHGSSVVIDVGSADVELDDLERIDFEMTAGSADVEIANSTGVFQVTTSSGDQSFSSVAGELELESGSGDIDLEQVEGLRRVTTNSGDVSGDDIVLSEDLIVTTGSGDVDLDLEHPISDLRFELSAGSGDLTVNDIGGEDALRVGDGPILVTAESRSGDQSYTTEE
jgi:DUF4097 and DUF4098 domain-containing protein YvlB